MLLEGTCYQLVLDYIHIIHIHSVQVFPYIVVHKPRAGEAYSMLTVYCHKLAVHYSQRGLKRSSYFSALAIETFE